MSISRHHAEWLSLVEQSGPFLSMPVLMRVFPQGLDSRDAAAARQLADAYESWQAAAAGPSALSAQRQWFLHVLTEFLGWPADFILEGQTLPPGLEAPQPTHGEILRPDFALRHRDSGQPPVMLIHLHPLAVRLESALPGHLWKASPATRMAELLRATRIPLGLVTNGEQWMLVHAKEGETSGFASWYADLWFQEGITLRAFRSLFTLSRFFGVAADSTLTALLEESRKDQQEVTDQLGLQVRQAVEVLVQAFDRLDAATERQLLIGVDERSIYESALTVMMRLVFLFAAEERGLLLLGDRFYDEHYAVSTLCDQLRAYADLHGEEILERRSDAWCRLLATFRAVHGGVEHETMRLPAYGGTLFDPDRYPFLEGRPVSSRWRDVGAQPLAVNNRVVLHLLEALQILRVKVPGGGPAEARRISFRALDIEQIGHVYEGLLDHIARRAPDTILGLQGAKGHDPAIPLHRLESLLASGESALLDFLEEETGRSRPALKNALPSGDSQPDAVAPQAKKKGRAVRAISALFPPESILPACGQDAALSHRIALFGNLLRPDSFGHPVIVQTGSLYVGPGSDRRSTGTHYTPKTLTEPIVQHTLDPLVYRGPAEGWLQDKWELKSPAEILALKVCDMAMGSGAFLVQTCRYLAEKLVESWERLEQSHPGEFITTPEGSLSRGDLTERLLPADAEERLAIARRCVSDRCLYGVDINPMAVEMAKLSLWLITLQKDRPFTFLDHALKCGDSLLGVNAVQQVENFSLRTGDRQVTFATANLFRYVEEAADKRRALEDLPSNDQSQIETKIRFYAEAEAATAKVKALADCLIAFELRALDGDAYEDQRTDEAEKVQLLMKRDADATLNSRIPPINQLSAYAREQLRGRRTFHWSVEFPEVFGRGGFDAFVGNPPFMGGRQMPTSLGFDYTEPLRKLYAVTGPADLVCYFYRRAIALASAVNVTGLLATNSISETVNSQAALKFILDTGGQLIRAIKSMPWPGSAAVSVAVVHFTRMDWHGERWLNHALHDNITASLDPADTGKVPFPLAQALEYSQGTNVYGEAFIRGESEIANLLKSNPGLRAYLRRYINGDVLNETPSLEGELWVIDFGELNENEISGCDEVIAELKLKVAYERRNQTRQVHESRPWLHWDKRMKFYRQARKQKFILATTIVSSFYVIHRVTTPHLFAHGIELFLADDFAMFGILQSALHEHWMRFTSGALGQTTRYTASKGLETFPFPKTDKPSSIAAAGEALFNCRALAMEQRIIGSNQLYTLVHDRGEKSEDIARLRALHEELDQAVAAAYGWSDLDLGHDFHTSKQGERYTLSEPARRTVLDRLLALNHQRHTEDEAVAVHDKKAKKTTGTRGRKKQAAIATDVRRLPEDWRFAHATPALYAVNLVTALLSSRVEGLPWPRLRDAFAAATTPSLLVRLALPDDKPMSEAWAKRWNEEATPEFLITALRHMGGGNLDVEGEGLSAVFALKDGPKPPATDDAGYDAWIALRVIGELELPVLDDAVERTLNAEIEEFLLAL